MKIVTLCLLFLMPVLSFGQTLPNPWEGIGGCYETVTVNGVPLAAAKNIPGNVHIWRSNTPQGSLFEGYISRGWGSFSNLRDLNGNPLPNIGIYLNQGLIDIDGTEYNSFLRVPIFDAGGVFTETSSGANHYSFSNIVYWHPNDQQKPIKISREDQVEFVDLGATKEFTIETSYTYSHLPDSPRYYKSHFVVKKVSEPDSGGHCWR